MFSLIQKAYAASCSDADFGAAELDLGKVLCLSDSTPVRDVYTSPAFLVNLLVKNIFVVGGVILFLMIFYAGFKFISQGSKGKEEAKGIVSACIAGLVLMFAAFWIVQIIQALTGVDAALPTP